MTDRNLNMTRTLALIAPALAALMLLTAPCHAQRFSNPSEPAKPEADKPAAPGGDDVRHVEGGGGRFTLPLKLYDEHANGSQDIARARERAKKDNRRVLVMWGENRCEFCAYLNELLTTDPMIKQLLDTEYVWVKVDIGKFDKNIDLAKSFQTPIDEHGFGAPALTVIEPNGSTPIGVAGGNAMVAKPMMPPNKVFDRDFVLNFLDSNKPQPKVATMLMLAARQKAQREGKRVLAYFNIYGSGACKAFDSAVNTPETESLLEKAFVIRKIDVERNIAGYDMLHQLRGSKTATPPWMTVLDAEGRPVAEAGKGVEFDPAQAAQAADWLIAASDHKLSASDRDALVKALSPAPAAPAAGEEAAASGQGGGAEAKK